MRIYHFGNFYMSSIQQGIQAAHCQTEMFLKYNEYVPPGTEPIILEKQDMLYEWAANHKTMICLSGGMDINLQEIKQLMAQPENPFPWSYFNESEEAMNFMLTNVAVILPEEIYETAANIRSRKWVIVNNSVYEGEAYPGNYKLDVSNYAIRVIELLNSCGLAK